MLRGNGTLVTPLDVEPLEGRTLMSGIAVGASVMEPAAKAPSYNLYNLLYTTRRGVSWTYNGDYAVTGDMTASGAGPATVGVKSKQKTYAGHRCNVVYTNSEMLNGSLAFYNAKDGVHVAAVVAGAELGTLTANLTGAVIAPSTLKVGGAAWSDQGTVAGTFNLADFGITGSLTGKATLSSKLLRTQRITVPAGAYNTVKGTMSVAMNGTLTLKAQGQSVRLNFTGTLSQTFWAVPGLGMVKFNTANSIGASYAGEKLGVTVTTHAVMKSHKVPTGTFATVRPMTAWPDAVTRREEVPVFA